MPAVKKQVVRNARRPRKQAAAPSHADADPRIVIMDAAERLCAERGLEAVSVRDIVAEANVNLSAINYYFKSLNNLLVSIFKRRGAEIEAEREKLLAEAAKKKPPELREAVGCR